MFLGSKKAQESMSATKIVAFIIAILVLVILIFMISSSSPRIMSWLRMMPGYESVDDSIRMLTADEARNLGYIPVGKIVQVQEGAFGTKKFLDWTVKDKYYIFALKYKTIGQIECSEKSEKYEWRNACYDYFGYLSDYDKKESDEKCKKYGTNFGGACFEEETNRLVKEEEFVFTAIYDNWKSGKGSDGDLIFLKNPKVGEMKDLRIFFESDIYNKYQNYFLQLKVSSEIIDNLDKSKYLDGALYRMKDDIKKASSANFGNSNSGIYLDAEIDLNINGGIIQLELGSYLFWYSNDAALKKEYFNLKKSEIGSIEVVQLQNVYGAFSGKILGIITPDDSIWVDKSQLEGFTRNPSLVISESNSLEKFYKTNLKVDYQKILVAIAISEKVE